MEVVYHRIRRTFDTRIFGPLPEEDKMHTLQAVFAVLCWLTSTLKPVIGENGTRHFLSMPSRDGSDEEGETVRESVVLFAENCSHTYASTDLRRPTSEMFYSFQPRPEGTDGGDLQSMPLASPAALAQAPGYNSEDVLHESSLNYGSLSEVGRVRIRWVDTLTAHLAFDRATRELSVYRYPSYCVAKILSQHKVEVLESIVERLLLSPYLSRSSQEPALIYREVLLSYRLIFGQSKKSREKLGRILSPSFRNARAPPSNAGETPRKKEEVDPFLRILCTSRLNPAPRLLSFGWAFGKKPKPEIRGDLFPSSAVNVDDELLEWDTYSASDDFPTFGPRLLALQRYNMRRQPSKMTDFWRDRRNPLQWYTFWAVVLVGGAGVVLALLQLVTGIIQTAYTINQKR
ncbi:hypothetical protein GE09DRAFT_1268365 [Coniochaeta sp. 2T2.1]|nr:hypothetical protein GE09DRAFT_1268365 [Coniochaeta sp. 2T2.1]